MGNLYKGGSLKRGTGADSPFLVLKIAENCTKPVADPGEGPGGNGLPLIFGPNRGPRGQKNFLRDAPLPPLKVWTRHCKLVVT